jgi:hypothetical protein
MGIKRFQLSASCVLAGLMVASLANAAVDASLPDWSKAGYKGGAALPTTGFVINMALEGVTANDGIDDTAAIQSVIDRIRGGSLLAAGQVVSESNRAILSFPAGVINISKQIRVDASWVTLRGAGNDPATGTRFVFKPAATYTVEAGRPVIEGKIWPGYAAFRVEDRKTHPSDTVFEGSINFHWLSGINVASSNPGAKGSAVVKLKSGGGANFQAGDSVYLGAANTVEFYNLMKAPQEYRYNTHMRSQMLKVVSVSGDSVTLDKPLEFDLPPDNATALPANEGGSTNKIYYSRLMKITAVRGVGFENFYFTQDISGTPYASTLNVNDYDAVTNPNGVGLRYTNVAPEYALHGILFKWAENSWVKGVRTYMTGSHPIVTEFARNMEFRDNVIYGAWNKGKGGHGYFRGSKLFDSKIVNNKVDRTRHVTLQWSASGNVVENNTFTVDMNLHGGWERNNLIQKNTINVPFGHSSFGEGEGGTDIVIEGTWYPLWWGAGPHASKWSGATGPQNVVFNNTMSKQTTKGGAYVTYAPYDSKSKIYQMGWDGSQWAHLEKPAGTFISTWGSNETVDFSKSPNKGVYSCLTYTGTSLLDSGTATNSCGGTTTTTTVTSVTSVTLNASEDGYVFESNATTNFAASTGLFLKNESGRKRYAYIKFSLAGAPAVTKAVLRVYASTGAATTLNAHEAVDTWSETTLNWNNRPLPGSVIAGVPLTSTAKYYEIDVTNYVKSQTDGVASFVLQETAGKYTTIDSRETSNKPQLVIN